MKRAMCVYLPCWPLQRLMHPRPELRQKPVVITQPSPGRGAKVSWCSERAVRSGIRPGMPVAEAKAIEPRVSLHEEDPRGDRAALQKLATWAERYSPIVGLEEGPAAECLFLDITGCASCFQGEDPLARRVRDEFRKRGWHVQVALADTVGAAWGLAHHAPEGFVAPPGETEAAVAPLPLAALRLPGDILQTLRELGVERIGALIEMPRSTLPGRFGPEVLRRLDQILGRKPELILPFHARPDVQARCSFEYATDSRAVLHHALDQLMERIVRMLQEQQRGAKHLECWFYHESAAPHRLDVRLFRASQSQAHLGKLLATRMEAVQIEDPVCGLCLRVPVVDVLSRRQVELFDTESPHTEELAGLIDRLVGRLGNTSVTFAKLIPDPQPEYACRFDPAMNEDRVKRGESRRPKTIQQELGAASGVSSAQLLFRPSSLIPRPEPIEMLRLNPEEAPMWFRWGRQEHIVRCSWGPEHIETGWWRGQDIQRDYYVVETDRGIRLWIFRRVKDGTWFLHGCFD